jgi:curved DNA-binding protein CbpA
VKDYYQILGVRNGASVPEIRRAYRTLVQRLHPDVNPDPVAHELIKEVNEAYDVLSDPSKKQEYDYRFNNRFSTIVVESQPQQPFHRDPYFRQKGRPKPQSRNEQSAQSRLMSGSLTFFRWVYKVTAVFCLIIFFL